MIREESPFPSISLPLTCPLPYGCSSEQLAGYIVHDVSRVLSWHAHQWPPLSLLRLLGTAPPALACPLLQVSLDTARSFLLQEAREEADLGQGRDDHRDRVKPTFWEPLAVAESLDSCDMARSESCQQEINAHVQLSPACTSILSSRKFGHR